VTTPPADSAGPELWMTVGAVMRIKGRGTVLVGRLEGTGQLSVGDALLCDGLSWRVDGIEQSRALLTTALPGSKIGVLLAGGPTADGLRGRTVQFAPSAAFPS
jgi:translation elongation factor EF-Tu-like GTPase